MSIFKSRALHLYLLGILCVAAGAQFSSMIGSMLPLAMGATTAVMTTVGAVRAIRARARR